VDLQSLKIDRGQPAAARRRSNSWPLRLVLRLVLLAAVGAAGWVFWPQVQQFVDRMRLPEVRTTVVSEPAAAAAAAIRGTAANGYVVAARRAALSSDVPGRIVELAVREGSVVKRGDIVARLYADEYRAALLRAVADLATAAANVVRTEAAAKATTADLAQAEANLATSLSQCDEATALRALAALEFARVRDLVGTGVGSQRDLDRAQSEIDATTARVQSALAASAAGERQVEAARERLAVAMAEIEVAKAQQQAAQATADQAKATLDKTDVRAPFDGIVVLKDAEVGEVVSPNVQGGSTARGAVCTMVDFDSLEVQANVPETTLPSVQLGGPADVFLDAFPDQRYQGVVDRIWPTADRQKATVEVRIRLERRDDRLRPEMGVRVVFRSAPEPGEAAAPAARPPLVVAETAIVLIGDRSGVFVLERDVVRFVPVTTGERKNGRIAVTAGLTAGQTIVLDPPPTLQDQDRVRLAAN
jgi:RND family efflux transporter MFP subunit